MAVFGGSPITRGISQLTQNLTNEMQKEMNLLYASPDIILRETMKKYEEDQKYQAEKEARQKAIDDARMSTMTGGDPTEALMMQMLAQGGNPFGDFAPPTDYPAANMPMGPMGGPPMPPPIGPPMPPNPMWGPEGYPLSSVLDAPPSDDTARIQGLSGDTPRIRLLLSEIDQFKKIMKDGYLSRSEEEAWADMLWEDASAIGNPALLNMVTNSLQQSFIDTQTTTKPDINAFHPDGTRNITVTPMYPEAGPGALPSDSIGRINNEIANPLYTGPTNLTPVVDRSNRDVIQAYLGEAGSDAELAEQLGPEVGLTDEQSRKITEQYMALQNDAMEEPGASSLSDMSRINALSTYRSGQKQMWNLFKTSTGFFNNLSETARTLWDSWEPYISMQYGLESNNPNRTSDWGPNSPGGTKDYIQYIQAITDPNDPRAQLWSKKRLTEIMKSVTGRWSDASGLYNAIEGTMPIAPGSGQGDPTAEVTPQLEQDRMKIKGDIRSHIGARGSSPRHDPNMAKLQQWFGDKGNFANMFAYLFTKDMNPIQRKAAQPALVNQMGADYLTKLITKNVVGDTQYAESVAEIESLYSTQNDLGILEDMLQNIMNNQYSMEQTRIDLPSRFAPVTSGALSTGVMRQPEEEEAVPEDQGGSWLNRLRLGGPF